MDGWTSMGFPTGHIQEKSIDDKILDFHLYGKIHEFLRLFEEDCLMILSNGIK